MVCSFVLDNTMTILSNFLVAIQPTAERRATQRQFKDFFLFVLAITQRFSHLGRLGLPDIA
jgi:hypothetical protein